MLVGEVRRLHVCVWRQDVHSSGGRLNLLVRFVIHHPHILLLVILNVDELDRLIALLGVQEVRAVHIVLNNDSWCLLISGVVCIGLIVQVAGVAAHVICHGALPDVVGQAMVIDVVVRAALVCLGPIPVELVVVLLLPSSHLAIDCSHLLLH